MSPCIGDLLKGQAASKENRNTCTEYKLRLRMMDYDLLIVEMLVMLLIRFDSDGVTCGVAQRIRRPLDGK